MLTTVVTIRNLFRKESKEEAVKRGSQSAFKLLSEYKAEGISQQDGAKRLYALSSGECNTTDSERWFDEGLRNQLAALGYQED